MCAAILDLKSGTCRLEDIGVERLRRRLTPPAPWVWRATNLAVSRFQRCGSRWQRDSQPEAGILNEKGAGADTQIRTADLLFTKQLLYR